MPWFTSRKSPMPAHRSTFLTLLLALSTPSPLLHVADSWRPEATMASRPSGASAMVPGLRPFRVMKAPAARLGQRSSRPFPRPDDGLPRATRSTASEMADLDAFMRVPARCKRWPSLPAEHSSSPAATMAPCDCGMSSTGVVSSRGLSAPKSPRSHSADRAHDLLSAPRVAPRAFSTPGPYGLGRLAGDLGRRTRLPSSRHPRPCRLGLGVRSSSPHRPATLR